MGKGKNLTDMPNGWKKLYSITTDVSQSSITPSSQIKISDYDELLCRLNVNSCSHGNSISIHSLTVADMSTGYLPKRSYLRIAREGAYGNAASVNYIVRNSELVTADGTAKLPVWVFAESDTLAKLPVYTFGTANITYTIYGKVYDLPD